MAKRSLDAKSLRGQCRAWGYRRNPEPLRTHRSLAGTLAPFGNYTFAFARHRRSNQTSVTIAAATSQTPSNAVPAGKVKKAR
jgi:hypothetical protein